MLKQFLIYSAGAILLRLITAGSVLATIKFIPPAQFGLLALLNNLIVFMPIILGLGLRQVLAIEFFTHKNPWGLVWELITIYLTFALPITALLFLNLNHLNQLLFFGQINTPILALAIITSLLNFFPELLFQLLRFQNKALNLMVIQVSMGALLASTTIYLLKFCNFGLTSVIWAQFITQLLATGYFIYLLIINKSITRGWIRYTCLRLSAKSGTHHARDNDPSLNSRLRQGFGAQAGLKSLISGMVSVLRSSIAKQNVSNPARPNKTISYLKTGLPFVPNIIFAWLIMACNRWLLNWQLDLKDVGLYSLAENISLMFQALITQPMMHSFLPYAFNNFAKNPDQIAQIDKQYTRWACYFIIFFVTTIPLGFMIFRPVLCYLLPAKYLTALPLITPLLIAQVIFAGTYLTSASLQYRKKTHYLAILMATSALLAISLNLWLIPTYGTWACVIASNCAYLCYFGLIQAFKSYKSCTRSNNSK